MIEMKEKMKFSTRHKFGLAQENQFLCRHCRKFVFTGGEFSGVRSRNHCPFCLHSRHLDLVEAGDRLSACKGVMKPVGLTRKQTHKKYNPQGGELMLIHMCQDCGKLSINRIARDDDAHLIYEYFQKSFLLTAEMKHLIYSQQIALLGEAEADFVIRRLFGQGGMGLHETWQPEEWASLSPRLAEYPGSV